MNITLNNDEINKAIELFIANQGIDLYGKDIDILLINGRKGNGCKAEVSISPSTTPKQVEFDCEEEEVLQNISEATEEEPEVPTSPSEPTEVVSEQGPEVTTEESPIKSIFA